MPSDGIWTWSEDNLQWIYRKNATSPPYKILLIGRVKSKFFKLTRVETLPKRVSVNLDLVGAAQTKFAKALLKVHSKNGEPLRLKYMSEQSTHCDPSVVSNEYPDIQVACWSETDSDGEVRKGVSISTPVLKNLTFFADATGSPIRSILGFYERLQETRRRRRP